MSIGKELNFHLYVMKKPPRFIPMKMAAFHKSLTFALKYHISIFTIMLITCVNMSMELIKIQAYALRKKKI